ncbi:MAG: hypothetical protein GY940_27185, partial [bacterium]|nr:hypothetical protein [bacterium]
RNLDKSIKVREYLYKDSMEQKLYQDYLGETIRKEHMPRFVWHCQEGNGEIHIQLKLAAHQVRPIHHSAATLENVEIFTLLPEILLQSLWDIDITPYLEDAFPDTREVARHIHGWSTPLIQFQKHRATRFTQKMFLSLKDSQYLDQLLKHLRPHFPSRDHVKGTDFRDAHAFSSISVLDSLPLPSLRPYEQAEKKYLGLDALHRQRLHVFAAEQNAALYEAMLPRVKEPKQAFHPRFISHLELLERTRLFAAAAIYDLVPNLFQYDVETHYLEVPGQAQKHRYQLSQKQGNRNPTPLDALRGFNKEKGKSQNRETQPIPFHQIRDYLKNNPPAKDLLLQKQTQLTTMKADKELAAEVR